MRNKEPITELGALVDALYVDQFENYRKINAYLTIGFGEVIAREFFDRGIGHSSTYFERSRHVVMSCFEEAQEKEFIIGVLKPGFVSKTEFILTTDKDLRQREIFPLLEEWREKDFWQYRSSREIAHGQGPGTYVRINIVNEPKLPESVRTGSIGKVLPADPVVMLRGDEGCPVYSVPHKKAIKIFFDLNREMAVYWQMLGVPRTDEAKTRFYFRGDEVEEFVGSFIRHCAAT